MEKKILYSNATDTNEIVIACGIFAHGKLEKHLGYDVVCPRYQDTANGGYILPDFREDGVYDVQVKHHDELIEARLYYWMKDGWNRGLVVYPSDSDAVADAESKFNRRVSNL